jgi:PUA domain protein
LRKYTLSKSDAAGVIEALNRWPKSAVPEKLKVIQVVEIEEGKELLTGDDFEAVKIGQKVLPLLANESLLKSFPSVRVDMGAVRFVCNGANVMRPGIVQMDDFKKGDIVVVKDNTHGKYLAVGLALTSSEDAKAMSKGSVVENKHYISDKFWEAYKQKN